MAPGNEQSPTSGSCPAPRVVAIVLAAGASSRMGTPKALLDFDGATCLELILKSCADAALAGAILVTAPSGGAVRDHAADAPLPTALAINDQPERGMLSSLQAGLRALGSCSAFLIFPVDFPLIPAAEIRRLVAAYRQGGGLIFVPSYGRRRGHPVLMDVGLAPELLALDASSSARAVIAAHEAELAHVEAQDDRVLMDMDTPDDYQKCLTRHRAGG